MKIQDIRYEGKDVEIVSCCGSTGIMQLLLATFHIILPCIAVILEHMKPVPRQQVGRKKS